MITNIPKAEELCESSLLLYFKAWESLTDLIKIFEETYNEKLYKSDNSESDYDGDREDYLEKCHPELQICVNLIQQSNELALKSKIAATSPYLLLSGLESNIKTQAQNYDFYTLKTVDASNLYKLVNAVCTTTLSNKFNALYQKYRKIRNMITHLEDIR